MTEEILYALSNISSALSVFRQPATNWEELTRLTETALSWRTRYDAETKLLIEEQDNSQTRWGDWKVSNVHQDVEDKTEAVILAARLTQNKQNLYQTQELLGNSTVVTELGYDPLDIV